MTRFQKNHLGYCTDINLLVVKDRRETIVAALATIQARGDSGFNQC